MNTVSEIIAADLTRVKQAIILHNRRTKRQPNIAALCGRERRLQNHLRRVLALEKAIEREWQAYASPKVFRSIAHLF
jgi:hypothetical protein